MDGWEDGVSSQTLRSQAQHHSVLRTLGRPSEPSESTVFYRHETSNNTHPSSTSHDTELMGALQPGHQGQHLEPPLTAVWPYYTSFPICAFTTHLESGDPQT